VLPGYLIAVLPPAEIASFARAAAKEFSQRFQSHASHKNIPHISMIGMTIPDESVVAGLRLAMRKMLSEYQPFKSILNGFDGFAEHTIYIRVMEQGPFRFLGEKLNQLIGDRLGRKPGFVRNPHLTVAYRDLTRENFHAALPEFKARKYEALLEVNSVCLLRQNYGWKLVEEFPLAGSLGYDSRQAELFVDA
jgi:2'-5' RNA ligase